MMNLARNMGTVDRVVRLIVAAVIAILCLNGTFTGMTAIVLGVLAVVFASTSVIAFCPLYPLVGLSTLKS